MLPVISALLAFVAGLFRSRVSLFLEHLALRHQLAVYQQTVDRPRLRSTDRVLWAWLTRLWPGGRIPQRAQRRPEDHQEDMNPLMRFALAHPAQPPLHHLEGIRLQVDEHKQQPILGRG